MSQINFKSETNIALNKQKETKIISIGKALSVQNRIEIIKCLLDGAKTITEIADYISLPISNTIFHLKVLENANIVKIFASGRGYKVSLLTYDININFKEGTEDQFPISTKQEEFSIGVGQYIDYECFDTFLALKDENGSIINVDDPFDENKRRAQLIFTGKGFVVYPLPKINDKLSEIQISLEICSEAPFYANEHPSEIFFSINDINLCSYICPGDFGGRKGNLNPPNYPDNLTQFGQLKTIFITKKGVFLDGKLVNKNINLSSLNLKQNKINKFKVGNSTNSNYIGGYNIFGEKFGDYNQAIKIIYKYY